MPSGVVMERCSLKLCWGKRMCSYSFSMDGSPYLHVNQGRDVWVGEGEGEVFLSFGRKEFLHGQGIYQLKTLAAGFLWLLIYLLMLPVSPYWALRKDGIPSSKEFLWLQLEMYFNTELFFSSNKQNAPEVKSCSSVWLSIFSTSTGYLIGWSHVPFGIFWTTLPLCKSYTPWCVLEGCKEHLHHDSHPGQLQPKPSLSSYCCPKNNSAAEHSECHHPVVLLPG